MVYSIADPATPARVGACVDSGYVTSISGNTVVLMLSSGVGFIDVTNPAQPHRVGDYAGYLWSACARDNICCVTVGNPNEPDWLQMQVLDISDPSAVFRLGSLDSAGGYNLVIEDSLVFASGFYTGGHEFQVISIRDSTHPTPVGALLTPGDNWDVWVNRPAHTAYVADRTMGLAIIDISNPALPILDTEILRADMAYDVSVQDGFAYVADYTAGLKVLDISNPTNPTEIGLLDTMAGGFTSTSVAARDSFVFASWWPQPYFRSIDVSDPETPQKAGGCNVFDQPGAVVIRDSFAYLAERLRFHVVNVARPREPVLVGSCVLGGDVWDLDVEDTMAYVTSNVLTMVNIARLDSPRVVATWNAMVAVDVEDTIAYTIGSGAVWSVSVARPTQPYVLDTVGIPDWKSDVIVGESLLFAGGQTLYVIDKRDPRNLRIVGRWTPPEEFRRLLWSPPYIYAACYGAGVCILETRPTGIAERHSADFGRHGGGVFPSVTRGPFAVDLDRWPADGVYVRNATGQRVAGQFTKGGDAIVRRLEMDLSGYPDGVYFIEATTTTAARTAKVIKTGGR